MRPHQGTRTVLTCLVLTAAFLNGCTTSGPRQTRLTKTNTPISNRGLPPPLNEFP